MTKIVILGLGRVTAAQIALAQIIEFEPPIANPINTTGKTTGFYVRYYEPASEKHPNEQWRGKGKRRKPRN